MDVKLRAGTPNDANRDYVPLAIKGTDMVVNENGNNSQVYPNLIECTGDPAGDGRTDRWYEYVPASYDGSKAVPLVVSNHGGLMTGWAQAVYSSWTMLAEREGFICVFPDAPVYQMWTIMGMAKRFEGVEDHLPLPDEPADYHDNHDLNFVKGLIEQTKKKYNIDSSRVFMQGMSMGHMMTDQFARFYGDMLTGAAGSGASAVGSELYDEEGNLINYGGPLNIWISHPETNGMGFDDEGEAGAQKKGREYWKAVNGCKGLPTITMVGEDNIAYWEGEKADVVWMDIKNRDHGQTLDEAYVYWKYMFKDCYRDESGKIVRGVKPEGDAFGLALTAGVNKAWFHNGVEELSTAPVTWQKLKYHGLDGGQMVRGEYLCVPVSYLAKVFGLEYTQSEDTLNCEVKLPDGRTVQFARGIIGAMVGEDLVSMYCEALHRNGELLVSVEWFCKYLFNCNVTSCNGVVYVTDHFCELSEYMAILIQDILKEN